MNSMFVYVIMPVASDPAFHGDLDEDRRLLEKVLQPVGAPARLTR